MKRWLGLLLFFLSTAACADTEWEKYLSEPNLEQAARVSKIERSGTSEEGGGDAELRILQD